MSDEEILSGDESENRQSDFVITGEGNTDVNPDVLKSQGTTLKERIALSTGKGMGKVPNGFDDQEGDWVVINSNNPFEVLYLDYNQYRFITKEIIENNYGLLEKFWRDKLGLLNTGGNRVAFRAKYGEGTIENSLVKLKRAFDKLSNETGIYNHYIEINNARLRHGEDMLHDTIEDMLIDGMADKEEITLRLERGLKYELSKEETAVIIKKYLENGQFKPYGVVSKKSVAEELLSVECWLTDEKFRDRQKEDEEKKKRGREIFENVYAYGVEEIGEIIFNKEVEAKKYIKEGLLKEPISYFSVSKASQYTEISKAQKDEHLRFLQISYRLNSKLPYRFSAGKTTNSVKELCTIFFENNDTFKTGKEQFKKGYVEIWLQETRKDDYKTLVTIRDSAENLELAFLEFIYTFNSGLPYRFAGQHLVKSPLELYQQIEASKENWEAGKVELYDSTMLVWLKITGHTDIVEKWKQVATKYKSNKDLGLEEFLRLLNPQSEYPNVKVNNPEISFPAIQSGNIVTSELSFTNVTRGYVHGELSFTSVLDGVTLSKTDFDINNSSRESGFNLVVTINSNYLLKGVDYKTEIQLATSANQNITIPIAFKIVFPKNAFFLEVLKYVAVLSAVFIVVRLAIASVYSDWLNKSFTSYLSWKASLVHGHLAVFGWTFLLFVALVSAGGYFLFKYLFSPSIDPLTDARNNLPSTNSAKSKSSSEKKINEAAVQEKAVVNVTFAVTVDSTGNAQQEASTFTIPAEGGGLVSVLVKGSKALNMETINLALWEGSQDKKWNKVDSFSRPLQKEWASFWFPYKFLREGNFCLQVLGAGDKILGEGYVTIKKK